MSKPPVFIIGVPRSGTTLLATLLEGHPQLYVDDEAVALRSLLLRARLEHSPPADALAEAIREDPRLERFYAGLTPPLGPALTERLEQLADGQQYVDKSPDALPRAAELAGLFPGSRFVHVVRDPRPTVASLRRRQYLELTEAALLWRDWTDRLAALNRWWPPGALHCLRYEDLVGQPAATLRKLCAFLDIDYRPQMLDLAASSATGGGDAYVRTTLDPTRLNDWRRRMPARDAALVEDICRPAMERLGYPTDRPGAPDWRPGYWERYRRQVAHKVRLLAQGERRQMRGRRLHDYRVPLGLRLGALGKAILRGVLREELFGRAGRSHKQRN